MPLVGRERAAAEEGLEGGSTSIRGAAACSLMEGALW